MGRRIIQIIIITLVVLNAGYMAYDGYCALTTGDYIRPTEGEYAGQLGPWTMFASMANIDPLSITMKLVFFTSGFFGLLSILVFLFIPRLGYAMLLLFCFLTLWNLMFGALISFITIILLMSWKKLHTAHLATRSEKSSID